jgi:lysophospholipase L1-like esterase
MMKLCVIGNSVAASRTPKEAPLAGWGQYLAEFLAPACAVRNYARDAMTLREYYPTRFVALLNLLDPGDLVAIEFGAVDQRINVPKRYHSPREFKEFLYLYVDGIRNEGAVPILVTPSARCVFDADGRVLDTHDGYPHLVREVAAETGTALLDLNGITTAMLQELGWNRARQYYNWLDAGIHPNYPDGNIDSTHFNETGAREVARLFATALQDIPDVPPGLVDPRTLTSPMFPPLIPEFTVENPESALYPAAASAAAPVFASPSPAALVSPQVKFKGKADEDTSYILFFENGTYIGGTEVGRNGAWQWRRVVSWTAGDHVLQAVGITSQGTSAAAGLPFTVLDRVEPPVVLGPADGSWSGPRPRFSGTAATGVSKVMVLQGERLIAEAAVKDDGTWSVTHPHDWRPGTYTVEFVSVFSALSSPPTPHTLKIHGIPDGNWIKESVHARESCGDACDHHPFAGRW